MHLALEHKTHMKLP